MTEKLTCVEAQDLGLPERYAAGTLDDEAVERFEAHFLTCARCQEAVDLAVAVRAAARPRRLRLGGYLGAGGFALAAALVVFVVIQVRGDTAVRSLGRLNAAPAYGGVAVRGSTTPDDSLFASAMADYSVGRYDSAAAHLATLAATNDEPPVNFFLGVSLLMLHRPSPAAAALARVIDAGNSPYAADARYYRALAFLQADLPDSAEFALRAVARDAGASGDRARALLARLEERRSP